MTNTKGIRLQKEISVGIIGASNIIYKIEVCALRHDEYLWYSFTKGLIYGIIIVNIPERIDIHGFI